MKVIAKKDEDSVVCTFPDGDSIEITMISVYGEDVCIDSNVDAAMGLLQKHLPVLAPQQMQVLVTQSA